MWLPYLLIPEHENTDMLLKANISFRNFIFLELSQTMGFE